MNAAQRKRARRARQILRAKELNRHANERDAFEATISLLTQARDDWRERALDAQSRFAGADNDCRQLRIEIDAALRREEAARAEATRRLSQVKDLEPENAKARRRLRERDIELEESFREVRSLKQRLAEATRTRAVEADLMR